MLKKLFSIQFLKRLTLSISPLIFISAILYGVYYAHITYGIKAIEVQGLQDNQQLVGLKLFEGKNLLILNTSYFENKIIALNPTVESLSIEKFYPSTLVISAQMAEQIARLRTSKGYFYLSDSGKIIAKNRIEDEHNLELPIITHYQKFNYFSFSSGAMVDLYEIMLGIRFIQLLNSLSIPIQSVDIEEFDLIRVLTTSGQEILLTGEKEIDLQEYQFRTLIGELKKNDITFLTIDLRYDKPVYTRIN